MRLLTLISLASLALGENYNTYPQVPQTASINGFADPIYSKLPSCALSCVRFSTGNTPCPYWDTGCLCVMPQWSGEVAQCVAENCKGSDVIEVADLASSLCSSVGANTWMMPASISTQLSSAAGNAKAPLVSAEITTASTPLLVSASARTSDVSSSLTSSPSKSSSNTQTFSKSSSKVSGLSSSKALGQGHHLVSVFITLISSVFAIFI